MIRASRLEHEVYEEVEHDREATSQAALIVVGTGILAGIGALGAGGPAALVLTAIFAIIGWAVYAFLTYWIGTRLFSKQGAQADWGEMARTLGFANSPRVLLVFGIIPILGALISLAVAIWVLVATVVAVRAALDIPTVPAIITAVLAWLAQVIVTGLAVALFLV